MVSQETEVANRVLSPPYISFTTFTNCLDWIKKEGIPHQFDRSFWSKKFSGTTGPQLMAAMRFLGFLNGELPQPELKNLVDANAADRKVILRETLRRVYATVKFDQLPAATPKMLQDWFDACGLERHTKRKAISFFINASKDADVPLSNAIRKMARNKTSKAGIDRAKRMAKAKPDLRSVPASRDLHNEQPLGSPSQSQTKEATINLASGGSLTLALSVDLFRLSPSDRDFVLKLVDHIRSYQPDETT